MKKFISLFVLMIAFVTNAVAWDPVIREVHYFGMYFPDSYEPVETAEINCAAYNGWSCDLNYMKFKNRYQPNTQKVTFRSWTDNSKARFALNAPGNWEFNKTNNNGYSGPGLYNKTNDGTNIWIRNLEPGDRFILEYYRNNSSGPVPTYVASNNNHNSATVTGLSDGTGISGTDEYTCTNGGDVCFRIPAKAVIRSLTIIHANYQTATNRIEEVRDNENNKGYRYTFTGAGVLENKRGAVPYITMRFGHENDMTFVRDLGNGNYGASCIVDESDNLNLDDSNVRLSAVYKKRYMNHQNQYSTNMGDVEWTNNSQEQQAELKTRAQKEANMLKGREWTVFEADNNWDGNINWNDPLTHRREFKWVDNFASILPLYGTYYYFFPEVKGKLSLKFYCEGNGEHMPFWYKSKEGVVVDDLKYGQNTNDGNYYEYKDLEVEKGGVYYLCANPTIVAREHPIVRLISYEFIPEFHVDPLYSIIENGAQQAHDAATIKGVTIANFTGINGNEFNNNQKITINGDENAPMIKFLGNVTGAKVSLRQAGDDIKLDFDNITYKTGNNINKGGAIVVNLDCPAGRATYVLTVAYNAADAKWGKVEGKDTRVAVAEGGVEVKKWDFFSEPLAIGTYVEDDGTRYTTNKNAWLAKSQLFREVHKADGLTADWVNTYMDVEKEEEQIFKSVYDMEGDNADMLEETEGLVFFTESNQLGIFNENAPSNSEFRDRYIGFIGGGKMWIPNLEEGDRIVLKMGRYGKDSQGADKAHLTITGAQDAIGTPITSDYVIGGSGVATGNDLNNGADITDKSKPWGEYHFISTGGHFKLEVTDATLLKLYSIVIYKHDDTILTENELLGDEEHLQILNTQDFTTAVDNVQLHMHYRGLQEETNYAEKEAKTGNLSDGDITVTSMTSNQSLWYTFFANSTLPITPDKAKFGVFKARLGVQTMDEIYVTDYADAMIPVGYRETKTYPYTWDFTDLKKYVTIDSGDGADGIDASGNELQVADNDLKIWKNWNMRVKADEWDGNIFASGGQLYGGTTMFEETKGIGITYENNDQVTSMTGTNTDETGGLKVGNGTYGFIVPQVDKEQAIYVRAAKVGSAQSASYEESNGNPTYIFGQNSTSFPYSAEATDGSGDMIFALVMPSNLAKKHDVRLNFKGYEVKKIAVSTDPKKVNKLGWATESRARVIDPELTSYLTGHEFKTYIVTGADHASKTVTLAEVEVDKKVMPISENGDENAYIIRNMNLDTAPSNTEPGRVKILNDGFHLFVPDMHDYVANRQDNLKLLQDMTSSLMKSQLTEGTVTQKGDGENVYNYVLTTETAIAGANGENLSGSEQSLNYVGFFRAQKSGVSSSGNQGYLPLTISGTTNAKYSFVFVRDWEVPTTIELPSEKLPNGIESVEGNASYYNMNGQRLNGRPSKSGIYIVNGKKVILK